MINLTMGSLFDGSGGFPLGAMLNGITPIWSSEVEPFPIRVTTKLIPQMKHYGDICKLNGEKLEPVDIITFGSPCTDLSLAGKRSGLDGEKSSLFYEAIRVIKEMRCATNDRYPRFAVFENVPGAFSSAKGQDFKTILEEFVKIKNEALSVPMPEKDKWLSAGEIVGDGFSIAWRTLDAQHWGVAQRRRRIYLVADFAGECAGKILFEREGVSWNSSQGGEQGQGASGDVTQGTGKTGTRDLTGWDTQSERIFYEDGISPTLGGCDGGGGRTGCNAGYINAVGFEPGAMSRLGGHHSVEQICTLRAQMGDNQACVAVMGERQHGLPISENVAHCLLGSDYKGSQCVFENHSQDTRYVGPLKVAQTVSANYGLGGNNQPFVVDATPKTLKIRSGCDGGGKGALIQENKSATLSCNNEQTLFEPKAYGICSYQSNSMLSDNANSGIYEAETSRTLDQGCNNPSCNQGGIAIVEQNNALFCIDQGGEKSSCNVSENLSPTITCTHGGEPAVCIQGSVIGRADKNGPNGSGINKDVSFTLDTTSPHAVVYAIDRETFNCGQNFARNLGISSEGVASTINAQGPSAVASFYPQMKAESQCYRNDGISNTLVNGTNPGFQNGIVEPTYTVRRLTPLECCRLQGFPDFWCSNLEIENPTEEDISFWVEVFETHRHITKTSSKPKSRGQIIKWLKNPYSDGAEYKMWGNGVALPCVCFVMGGIAHFADCQ